MTNAIFDLSNMFFRSLFIVGGYGAKQYTFDSQYELDQLMRKVATIAREYSKERVISSVFFFPPSASQRNIQTRAIIENKIPNSQTKLKPPAVILWSAWNKLRLLLSILFQSAGLE